MDVLGGLVWGVQLITEGQEGASVGEASSVYPVCCCQVDGGDQESHQLSGQVQPAAAKG